MPSKRYYWVVMYGTVINTIHEDGIGVEVIKLFTPNKSVNEKII